MKTKPTRSVSGGLAEILVSPLPARRQTHATTRGAGMSRAKHPVRIEVSLSRCQPVFGQKSFRARTFPASPKDLPASVFLRQWPCTIVQLFVCTGTVHESTITASGNGAVGRLFCAPP